jgi:hypothetical protein
LGPAEVKAGVSIVRVIGETLSLRREGRLWTAPCPFHAENAASFTVYADHYHCYGCREHGDVLDWLTSQRGMSFREALTYLGAPDSGRLAAPLKPLFKSAVNDSKAIRNLAAAQRIWGQGLDPYYSIIQDYLHIRGGLELPPPSALGPVIRFHPECPCGDLRLPAMIALLSDPVTGAPTGGIHRTFLKADGSGKADIPKPKMMLGPWGVVRLYKPETAGIGLAEGIETALAVAQRIGWGPVWAACTAGGFSKVPPLIQRTLNLFIDRDDDGVSLREAERCARAWVEADLEVYIHEPPDGTDWADVARGVVP